VPKSGNLAPFLKNTPKGAMNFCDYRSKSILMLRPWFLVQS